MVILCFAAIHNTLSLDKLDWANNKTPQIQTPFSSPRKHSENKLKLVLSLESKICIPISLLFAHNQNPNSYSTILSVMNSYSNSLLNKSKPLFITSEYAAHWNTDFTDNEYKSKLSSQQNQKWKINLVKIIKIMFSNSELFIGLHFQKN